MLKTVAGITRIQKLYLQMLFRCNFNCVHCFQGVNLQRNDRFTLAQAEGAIALFAREYGLRSVTLLGGEPFLHPELDAVLRFCKQLELETVVCTNGYKIGKLLRQVASRLDCLRVSIDGIRETHDAIRRSGSFDAALHTLDEARSLGISTSITTTVMRTNVHEIYDLARTVAAHGVQTVKLHQLRLVGNAKEHPELLCDNEALQGLSTEITNINRDLKIHVMLDDDLDPQGCMIPDTTRPDAFELERIEVLPDGATYVSCKAVGSDSNAFWLDKERVEIVYQPTASDELATKAPQVRYAQLRGGDSNV